MAQSVLCGRSCKNKKNREVLGWIGAGFAVVIGGLWATFVHFSAPDKSAPDKTSTSGSTDASCGSAAIIGNVSFTAGNTGNCPEQKPEKKQ